MMTLHCDSTGNQDMAIDMLRSELRDMQTQIVSVPFTAQSKDEMFKNLSRLMSSVYIGGQLVQEPAFIFPRRDSVQKERFIKQMIDLQKDIRGGLWRCQHPDGPNYHDDYCFTKFVQVRTNIGWKYIDELKIGDIVLTHKYNWKKVTNTFVRLINNTILELTFNNGEVVEVTKNHPFLLCDDSWIESSQLCIGDRIKNIDNNSIITNIVEKKYFGNVYNIEVENDNSYLIKAGFVHNCASIALACMAFLPRKQRSNEYKPMIA